MTRTKQTLRAEFRARRERLSKAEADTCSEQICRHLDGSDFLADVDHLAGYMARGREANLEAYLRDFVDGGGELFLPRVVDEGAMEFCPVDDLGDLRIGAFGIAEPTTAAADPEVIDVFLVPGVVFDASGHRIGFGGGYYDRALSRVEQKHAIGVCYSWQFVDDQLPHGDHDQAMDAVVTDDQIYRIDSASEPRRE